MDRELQNLFVDGKRLLVGGIDERKVYRTYKWVDGARYEIRGPLDARYARQARAFWRAKSDAKQGIYQTHGVIDHRTVNGEEQYLVVWKGYKLEEASWEPASNVGSGLIAEYHDREDDLEDSDESEAEDNAAEDNAAEDNAAEDNTAEDDTAEDEPQDKVMKEVAAGSSNASGENNAQAALDDGWDSEQDAEHEIIDD